MKPLKEELTALLLAALKEESPAADIVSSFETPREEKFGDLSTHIVLRLAKEMKRPPRPMAE